MEFIYKKKKKKNHEEAETRMLLHAAHALACGYKRIMQRTVDTDVHVLVVFTVQMLKDRECQPFELWVSFGSGRNHRNIPAHMIASSLGPQKTRSLPAFLAFTGCDTVSSLLVKERRLQWLSGIAFLKLLSPF